MYEDEFEEEDVYGSSARSLLVEDEEISPAEDGFMMGYMDAVE